MKFYQKYSIALVLIGTFMGMGACQKSSEKTSSPNTLNKIVSGTIDLSPEAKAKADPLSVLFIIARTPQGNISAVHKMLPPFQFPLNFELTQENLMISGSEIPKELLLTARLDKDGNANPAQSGDIVTSQPLNVKLGDEKAALLLDKSIP